MSLTLFGGRIKRPELALALVELGEVTLLQRNARVRLVPSYKLVSGVE